MIAAVEKMMVSKIVVKERRRVDRDTMEEVERRRYERVELKEDAHIEDERGRRLGIVTDVSGGGLRVFFESDEQMNAFVAGAVMTLIVVEQNGTRNVVHVRVAYVNITDAGFQFV
ncbi:MAG TPA: PilZ domain-containing protein [Terriglobales bacterium]